MSRTPSSSVRRHAACLTLASALLIAAAPLAAQKVAVDNPLPARVDLSGPRFGITVMTGSLADTLWQRAHVRRTFAQFGWQFEKQFYTTDFGPRAVSELVVLAGGLDQGKVIPSVSWVTGIRMPGGAEFGVGPNATPVNVGLVIAGGITFHYGYLNIPLNVAMVPTSHGMHTSLLTGFNSRR